MDKTGGSGCEYMKCEYFVSDTGGERCTYPQPYCRFREESAKDAEIARLKAEVERLKTWVNDLQSGMYINCVYCGHRYGPQDKVPCSMAEALKKHIEQCPKHPMSALKQDIAAANKVIEGVREWASRIEECEPKPLFLKHQLEALKQLLPEARGKE